MRSSTSELVGSANSAGGQRFTESVLSSVLPEELWSDEEEEPIAMETQSGDKSSAGGMYNVLIGLLHEQAYKLCFKDKGQCSNHRRGTYSSRAD